MTKKIRVGIIFGGKSQEHEVALQSAKSIIEAIDKNKYELTLIGIDKNGRWQLNEEGKYLLNETNPELIQLNKSEKEIALVPGDESRQMMTVSGNEGLETVDVVFPVLHGTNGEDGTIQGMLKLSNIPFVGAGVLGSAVGMDKDAAKRLLRDAGLPIAKFVVLSRSHRKNIDFEEIKNKLGLPLFIKPANMGSSVGVSKAKNIREFDEAIEKAFRYDRKILVEEFVKGREIECSVLGNEEPIASIAGEIIPTHEFYSYEAKYIDEKGAALEIPAKIDKETEAQIQELSIKAFKTLCCEGMARVDFFLKEDKTLVINEINTIPGFTKISMYPKLWEKSGISYPELIDKLIELAIKRHEEENELL